jgi:VCBS repeat-containing protein
MKKLLLLVFSLLLLNVMALDEFQMKANQLFSEYNPVRELIIEDDVNPTESWDNFYREQNGRDQLMISTMPSYDVNVAYGNALLNQPIAIWGSARGGTSPYNWKMYVNNTVVDSGSTTNGRYIGINYTFTFSGLKTIKLEVTDATRTTDYSESTLRVHPSLNQTIEVNMAIEKGLLYLYNQAVVYSTNYIYWGNSNSDGGTAATGLSVLSFEENGHIPINNYQDDIYAETVRMGLNHLLTQSANTYSGHAYLRNNQYANGIAWLAVIMAHPNATSAQNDNITIGPFNGMNFYSLVQSGIDQYELSQGNSGEWHYTVATDNSSGYDGSCQQWPIFVFKAAEDRWGLYPDHATHTAAMNAYAAITNANGACGYGNSGQYLNSAKTGGMLVGYVWDGKLQDLGDANALQSISYIGSKWYNLGHQVTYPGWVADFYSMYGVKKGLELQNVETVSTPNGTRNWYDDMADWLLGHNTDFTSTFSSTYRTTTYAFGQKSTGGWQSAYGYVNSHGPSNDHLDTAHAILVLSKAVTTIVPVAVIDGVNSHPQNTSFLLSASNSYHPDPSQSIVEWIWDWDSSDGLDWNNPDATGIQPTNPGYADMGDYTITLRVKDDNDPPRYDTDTFIVTITSDNLPPVAVAIPEALLPSYAGYVGMPITLDGSESYDPDPEDSITEWSWDTDGNGTFGDAFGVTVEVTFPGEYQGSVGLQVTSSDGTSGTSSAYVDIVFSGTDIYVDDLFIYRMLENTTNLHLEATLKNNPSSSNGATNVQVQFFDGNPFTTGQRVGGSYYVDLPVGHTEILDVNLTVPVGLSQLYVFLDSNLNVAESNELNNVLSQTVDYGFGFDDNVAMNEDIAASFNLFTNDFQDEGALEITAITQPTYGQTTIVDALLGIVQYTPNQANYNGTDEFYYEISTPVGQDPTPHLVSVTINPINDSPVCTVEPTISGDSIIGATLTSTPTTWNDDIDDVANTVTLTYQWQSADNEQFTVNLQNISGANTDSYILTQNEKNKFVRLRVTGTDDGTPLPPAFAYAYSNEFFVQNNLPVITEGELLELTTNEDVNKNFFLEVTDIDANENFNWQFTQQPNFGQVSIVTKYRNQETIEFMYEPDDNANGLDSLMISVSDGADTDEIKVKITVTAVNDAPVFQFPTQLTFYEDDSATYNFQNYITDVDNNYSELTLGWSGNTNIDIVNDNWQVTFSSNVLHWTGQETITFTTNDGVARTTFSLTPAIGEASQQNRAQSQADVPVICQSQPDPPEINLPDDFTFNEDENLIVDFTPFVTDPDNDPLILSNDPTTNIIVEYNGLTVTLSATENWNGIEAVTFYVNDQTGRLQDSDTVDIIVTAVNDEPEMELPTTLNGFEDIPLVIDFSAYISDPEQTFTELTLTCIDNVLINVQIVELEVTFTTPQDWHGSELLTFKVEDNQRRLFATAQTLVVFASVNDDPEIILPAELTFDEDDSETYDFSGYLSDVDNLLSELTLSSDGSAHINVEIDGFEVTFSSNTLNWSGTESVSFTVSDNSAKTFAVNSPVFPTLAENIKRNETSSSLDVICEPVDDLILMNLPDELFVGPGETEQLNFDDYIIDVDGDDILIYPQLGNTNIIINNTDLLYDFTALSDWLGEEYILFIIYDGTSFATDQILVYSSIVPQEITIMFDGSDVELSWKEILAVESYQVYSSNRPDTSFTEELSGIITQDGERFYWNAPRSGDKTFYYVTGIDNDFAKVNKDFNLEIDDSIKEKIRNEYNAKFRR